jgi:hypothetical protein
MFPGSALNSNASAQSFCGIARKPNIRRLMTIGCEAETESSHVRSRPSRQQSQVGTQSERSATMLQAGDMVSVQAECRVNQALELMADRAAVQGMTIEQVAQALVDHSIRFGCDAL